MGFIIQSIEQLHTHNITGYCPYNFNIDKLLGGKINGGSGTFYGDTKVYVEVICTKRSHN